jgi:hypothetical protein
MGKKTTLYELGIFKEELMRWMYCITIGQKNNYIAIYMIYTLDQGNLIFW